MDVRLLDGVFSSTQYPHFFNGRILTATDLNQERDVHLNRSQYLAQALGDGIVDGLYVTQRDEKLHLQVSRGSAINRMGDVLHLSNEVVLDLTPSQPQVSPQDAIFRNEHEPIQTAKKLAAFYLLALTCSDTSPSARQLQTKSQPMGGQSVTTHYYEENHLRFKLMALDEVFHPAKQEPKRFRHRLAMACFGIGDWQNYLAKNSNISPRANLVETLRHHPFTPLADQDIPIAVLHIESDKIKFVDCWTVRRLCVPQVEISSPLAGLISTQSKSGAIEHFLQFQEQLENIAQNEKSDVLSEINAKDYFDWLPSAGLIPSSVYQTDRFFSGQSIINSAAPKDQPLDTSTVKQLMTESCNAGAIKLDADVIEIYRTKWKGHRYIFFVRHPSSLGEYLIKGTLIKDTLGVSAADYQQGQHRPTVDLRRAINALLHQILPGTIDIPTEIVVDRGEIHDHFMLHDTHGGAWLFWAEGNTLWCKHRLSNSLQTWLEIETCQVAVGFHSSRISQPFALQDSKDNIWIFWADSNSNFWCCHKSASSLLEWSINPSQVTNGNHSASSSYSNIEVPFGTAFIDRNGGVWFFWDKLRYSNSAPDILYKYRDVDSEKNWSDIEFRNVKTSIHYGIRKIIYFISLDQTGGIFLAWPEPPLRRIYYKYLLLGSDKVWAKATNGAISLDDAILEQPGDLQFVFDKSDNIYFFLRRRTSSGSADLYYYYKHNLEGEDFLVSGDDRIGLNVESFRVLIDKQYTIWVFWITSSDIWCKHKSAKSSELWSSLVQYHIASGAGKNFMATMDVHGEVWVSWISGNKIFCRSILSYL